jgi:hypothetical protein
MGVRKAHDPPTATAIRKGLIENPRPLATPIAIGVIIMARAPTLFIKADATAKRIDNGYAFRSNVRFAPMGDERNVFPIHKNISPKVDDK